MPGSLLVGNDTYSVVSDLSNRSLDSKTGGKKVSFNKAVRVKQYPWKPDLEVPTTEHLILPNNRFWFKVYKNRNESSGFYDYDSEAPLQSTWEENMDGLHKSLSPIEEVEDQDTVGIHTNGDPFVRNHFELSKSEHNYGDFEDEDKYPAEPPVDYFHDLRLSSNRGLNGVKQVWKSNEVNYDNFGFNNGSINNCDEFSVIDTAPLYGSLSGNDVESANFNSNSALNKVRLPRTNLKNEFSSRRSLKRFDDSNASNLRERRSRSHDDHIDNDSRCKLLRKTDKSVSTDDLNFSINPSNGYFKDSRDVATQCYGTLTRTNSSTKSNKPSLPFSQSISSINTTERLRNFKSPRPTPRQNNKETYSNGSTVNQKKDYSLEKISNRNRPEENLSKFSPQKKQNCKQYSQEELINNNAYSKPLIRTENNIADILQKQAAKTFSLTENVSSISPVLKETKKNFGITNQNNNFRNSNTVGYLRGRQIPLSEVNTNTSRKYLTRNNIGYSQRQVSCNDNENRNISNSPVKSINGMSNGNQLKRYIPKANNFDRRHIRSNSNSGKVYDSSVSEGGNSMIDWSLSGFQLASKSENQVTSVSDSEYTVHRRPPLLMYIPGVSHHDRPAIEDDRLSALSDVSRSEMRDGSEFANSSSDFHSRQSLREGKLKWMKWRSKR